MLGGAWMTTLLFFIFRALISTYMSIEDSKMQFPAKKKKNWDLEEVRETFFLCLLDIIFCIEFYTVIPRNFGFKKKKCDSLSLSL